MVSFADRLRAEIEYQGMLQKELAFKAGIKKRALDMYLGSQSSMPPADVAVRLAKVLGVTVEYLVTGEKPEPGATSEKEKKIALDFKQVEDDLNSLPIKVASSLVHTIHTVAEFEKSGLSDAHRKTKEDVLQ